MCAIFMSDIVTADGKNLEEFATARTHSREHAYTYKFPSEAPSQEDWITRRQF